MQQQKENLTLQLNETAAKQQALLEEDAVLSLTLNNITSSFHQLLLTDGRKSSEGGQTKFNQTSESNDTTEVRLQPESKVIFSLLTEEPLFVLFRTFVWIVDKQMFPACLLNIRFSSCCSNDIYEKELSQ